MIIYLPILLYVGVALWLRWNEPRMLYYPDRQIEQTPDHAGLKYEDVTLTTSDGVRINGWFVPGTDEPRLTVLLFHGNAGNISHRLEKLRILHDLGVNTFIIDYRGYGRSEGTPNEQGTYRDAQAAYEYLVHSGAGVSPAAPDVGGATEFTPPPGRVGVSPASADVAKARPLHPDSAVGAGAPRVSPRFIIIYGESLGSAIAADLASKQPAGGLIIEEAFTSVGDVGQKMFPFFPVRWLVRNEYDTLSKMPRIKVPLLILHSREDELINFRHAQRLFAAANAPKQLVELHGAHNDAFLVSEPTYRAALQQFLAALSAAR